MRSGARDPGGRGGRDGGGDAADPGAVAAESRLVAALPVWMRDRWRTLRRGRRRAVVRVDVLPWFRDLGLLRAAEEDPEAVARRGGGRVAPAGRGAVAILPAGASGEAVLRPYRRGGLPGRLLESRYFLGDRAFRELVVTERLHRAGLPVPEPLAAVQARRLPGYRAALLTRRVRGAEALPDLLTGADPAAAAALLARVGTAVGRLHAAGAWHADLSAGNLLLEPGGEAPAVVLDLDRARLLPPPLPGPLARLNLRRLRRSLRKLGLEAGLTAWPALEAAHDRALFAPDGAAGG